MPTCASPARGGFAKMPQDSHRRWPALCTTHPVMNDPSLSSVRTVLAILGLGLTALHCGGNSSSDASSSGGSAGTSGGRSGSAGLASGAAAGKASTGVGGSSGRGGGSSDAGSGQSGGSSGSAGSALAGGSAGGGAGGAGGDTSGAGMGGEAWVCDRDCDGGACWQDLNGSSQCVTVIATEPAECFGSDVNCCTADSECTDGEGGRCIPNSETVLSCGGAVPVGNACNCDACSTDADCAADLPADSTVAACVPPGALGSYTASCVYGVCRTDADCTEESGGQCIYGFAATHGGCDLRLVLSCAYPSDPCQVRYGDCDGAMVCAPEEDLQGQHCVAPPPMYP